MSGDGKRGVGHWPQATAPILDSTLSEELVRTENVLFLDARPPLDQNGAEATMEIADDLPF